MFIKNLEFFDLDLLSLIINWIYVIQIIIISFGILIITIYLPRKIESLIFLHRLSFGYLLLNIWLLTLDRLNKPFIDLSTPLTLSQYSTYLAWIQEDSLFSHLYFLVGCGIMIGFFYGILDKFFIKNGDETEFALLVFFIGVGTFFLFHIHNLIEFLLAIETVTLASYVCAGYERKNAHSAFASIQYFILGSIPSGMLILGLSLFYSYSGAITFEDLDLLFHETLSVKNNNSLLFLTEEWNFFSSIIYNQQNIDFFINNSNWTFLSSFSVEKELLLEEFLSPRGSVLIVGILFIFFNLLFKLTAAPFHFWAPSVYKNAPIASVTYLSIISKAMVVFLIIKLSLTLFYSATLMITPILFLCGVLTILLGLFGAFTEKFIKAFFVYSSMGHVGFMLVGLALLNLSGFSASIHYLLVYIVSSFVMWFTLLHMGTTSTFLSSFKELKTSDPILAIIFALLIFSMSGIPPLGGFFIKLDVLAALLEYSRFGINIILFFFTVASFFYYLRINKIIFFDNINSFIKRKHINSERLQLIIVCFFILLFYVLIIQAPFLALQSNAIASLF